MRYHKIILPLAGVLLLLGAGCAKQSSRNQPFTSVEDIIVEDVEPNTVVVRLGQQNNSGEAGVAYLYPQEDGKTKVSLKVKGGAKGVDQPAHIHTGSCAKIGEVTYPLNSTVSGVSETIINVSTEDLLKTVPLALNVHKSNSQSGTYVACGNIKK